jgi:hypothetical protein
MYLGFKVKLLEQDELIPNFGVLAGFSVPTGSAGFSSGDVDPEVVLAWSYDITDWFSVAGNIGIASATSGDSRFVESSASLAGGFSITDELGAYVEWYGIYSSEEGTGPSNNINGGFTYLITPNLQLDWRIGAGLSQDAPDFQTGVGISWRF